MDLFLKVFFSKDASVSATGINFHCVLRAVCMPMPDPDMYCCVIVVVKLYGLGGNSASSLAFKAVYNQQRAVSSSCKLPFALSAVPLKMKKSNSCSLLPANLGLLFNVRDHICEMI